MTAIPSNFAKLKTHPYKYYYILKKIQELGGISRKEAYEIFGQSIKFDINKLLFSMLNSLNVYIVDQGKTGESIYRVTEKGRLYLQVLEKRIEKK